MGLSTERVRGLAMALAAMAAVFLGVAVGTASAAPPVLNQFCPNGSGQGQCNIPRGIATNPTTGNIYVADQSNHRIQQFSAWGESIRTWGSQGSGPGQFVAPEGVGIDSSGNVYVVDLGNRRVQKFDSEGHFILMFGGEVDKTTNANVCTAASGDTCGAGVEGTGNGFFGALKVGSYIAVGPDGEIYVGDQNRIQVFDSSGTFMKSIAQPGTVQALAVDNAPLSPSKGDIYVTYTGSNPTNATENVQKLSPTGTVLATLKVQNPRALATNPSNGDVYVMNRQQIGSTLLRFNATGGEAVETISAQEFPESTGLAINPPETCGLKGADLIVSNSEGAHSFVRIYGPPPDPKKCPPEIAAPSIDDQFAAAVNASAATVKAGINPHFWTETTHYFVEYGTGRCSEGGCTKKQPAPPGALLAGPVTNLDLTTSGVLLAGLAPDTTYHYRFVAKSAGGGPTTGVEASFHTLPAASEPGTDSCPNVGFRTGGSTHLPDCRAYEMVSPVDKNGADIFTNTTESYKQEKGELAVADEAGRRMTFSSLRAFDEAEGGSFSNQYLATRMESVGWSTQAISSPRNAISFYVNGSSANITNYKLFSANLCSGWLLQDSPVALVPGAPDETGTLYRRDLCGGEGFEVSSSVAPPNFNYKFEEPTDSRYFPEVQGASADGANTVFRADDELIKHGSCETPGIFQVYETLGGGRLRLVSVLPSVAGAPGLPSCKQSSAGTAQGRPGEMRADSTAGAVSEDGERVYWTASDSSTGSNNQPGTIYLRDNARAEESKHGGTGRCTEATKACTYEVSGLVPGAPPARFLAGSADGSRAYFSSGVEGKEDLYEFEATEGKGSLGTTATRIAKGLQGFMGASKDGRRAYFVSSEPEPDWEGETGKNNLYFFEKGAAAPRLVGELSGTDTLGNRVGTAEGEGGVPSPVSPLPYQRLSRVSPDGLHAAFLSTAPLTGFDNTDAGSGEADAEAFIYDAVAEGGKGKLVCASCNATGARPTGRQLVNVSTDIGKFWAAAVIPGWQMQTRGGRALSDNGNRLFFTSFESLVLRDTNGRTDVYEWQAATSRQECLSQPMGGELFLTESSGCLSLISSGQSSQDSEFLDATPDGRDVFFATASSLVPQDPGLIDVYDARVDGGFASASAPRASCEGEACQSPPAPPNDQTPSSATYNGPENLKETPKKCAKGKIKKHGKCMRRKAKKKGKKKSKAKKSGKAG